ncbi:hypothetical protein [Bradyrhizobium sp. McL0616]|uniref:hypothetical protein n=1 Tax=Bradyrhizobium sp. McL0616 TaxID=3415674 RepID=UPI003CEA20CA
MAVSKALLSSVGSVPPSVLRRVREGFGYFITLAPDVRSQLFAEVGEMLRSGVAGIPLPPLAELSGLKSAQVGAIVTALAATISTFVQVEEDAGDFLEATRGKFFVPEDEEAVSWTLRETIGSTADWNSAFDLRKLANETLPSLAAFDVSIDLRLGFREDVLEHAVPVALVHLDTDGTGQEIWFQAARADVEMMLHELQTALRRIELAEQLYEQKLSR